MGPVYFLESLCGMQTERSINPGLIQTQTLLSDVLYMNTFAGPGSGFTKLILVLSVQLRSGGPPEW